eukprot:896586-Amorphochlora_amoeboformis.AAC.2
MNALNTNKVFALLLHPNVEHTSIANILFASGDTAAAFLSAKSIAPSYGGEVHIIHKYKIQGRDVQLSIPPAPRDPV